MRAKNAKSYVHKTPNGTFRIRFCDEFGKMRSLNVSTKTECENIQRCIKRGDPLDQWFAGPSSVRSAAVATFGDLAERFLEHRRDVAEISLSCLANYQTQLKMHILPVMGARKLDTLGIEDVEQLAKLLKNTKAKSQSYKAIRRGELFEPDEFLSVTYRREILTLACMIAKFGFERGLLARHPFQNFKLPDAIDQPYDYWRLDDEDKFLDWLEAGGPYIQPHTDRKGGRYDRHWKLRNCRKVYEVVLLALRTGMRRGEIAALTMDHVNFTSGLITVQSSWCEKEGRFKGSTKNGSYRYIEMNDDVKSILASYRHLPGKEPIFRNVMRSHTMKKFSDLTIKAGVRPLHFHGLRHTFLTNLANGIGLDAPVPLPKVMELAGHSCIETTMIYVHAGSITDSSSRQWSRAERKRSRFHLVQPPNAKEA